MKLHNPSNALRQAGKGAALVVLALCALLLPRSLNNYYLSILVEVVLYASLASAWNILGGFAGQFSLGHALYIGIGAYTSTILFNNWGISPWIGMIAGGGIAVALGMLIGYPSFKLVGTFFTLASLALSTLAMLIFQNTTRVAGIKIGGASGLQVNAVRGNSFWLIQFTNKIYYYYTFLAFLLLILLLCRYIKRSKIGYQLAAIANDQQAAEALGINSRALKLKAMAISAFISAVGGTFYAQYVMSCSPTKLFGESLSDELVIMSLIGGKGTILGPTLGAIIIQPLSRLTSGIIGGTVPGLHLVVYGALLIICIRFFPDGLYPLLIKLAKWIKGKLAGHKAGKG